MMILLLPLIVNSPVTRMINDVPAAPFNVITLPPDRLMLSTQATVGFAVAVIVVLVVIVPRFSEHGSAPAFVAAVLASAISWLRSASGEGGLNTVPRDPPPLCVKVAPESSR